MNFKHFDYAFSNPNNTVIPVVLSFPTNFVQCVKQPGGESSDKRFCNPHYTPIPVYNTITTTSN